MSVGNKLRGRQDKGLRASGGGAAPSCGMTSSTGANSSDECGKNCASPSWVEFCKSFGGPSAPDFHFRNAPSGLKSGGKYERGLCFWLLVFCPSAVNAARASVCSCQIPV